MLISLNEVEPYNHTGDESLDAAGHKFFSRVRGSTTFEFDCAVKPKCMLLKTIIYKEAQGLNTVEGNLISIDLDSFYEKVRTGRKHSDLIMEYKVGWIVINYRTEQLGLISPDIKTIPSIKEQKLQSTNSALPFYSTASSVATHSRLDTRNEGCFGEFDLERVGYIKSDSPLSNPHYSAITMKHIFLIIVVASTLGAMLYFITGNKSVLKVATACVGKECNLRSSPSKGKNVIKIIPKGSTIAIIENTGEWAKVRFNDSEGYIRSNLLSSAGK